MSEFIPNSFQTPNTYVDEFMHLLTPEEYKVLSYAVRRIFGFQKRMDRISLSQFEDGAEYGEGVRDYGTGLNRKTVVKALDSLTRFKLIEKVADNDKHLNNGACYRLQLDSKKVDREGLAARQSAQRDAAKTRTEGARKKSSETIREPKGSVSDTPATQCIPYTGGGVSHTPGVVYPIHTQKTEETQKKSRERAPAPDSPSVHPAIQVYFDAYKTEPNIFAQERIENEVKDLAIWRRAVMRLRTNGTPPKNIGTLLDAYVDDVEKAAKTKRAGPTNGPPSKPLSATELDAMLNRKAPDVRPNA